MSHSKEGKTVRIIERQVPPKLPVSLDQRGTVPPKLPVQAPAGTPAPQASQSQSPPKDSK